VTDPGYDIAEQRRLALEQAAAEPREDVGHVLDVDADGVPCRLYLPSAGPTGTLPGAIVFLHGGGFVFGDLDTHDAQSRRMANRAGLAVLAVDYRRPPEHRFPAAPDDVDTAAAWLVGNGPAMGIDISRLVALGDSAGGNLALVAALRNPNLFAATVLVYPFVDPKLRFESYRREAGGLGAAEVAGVYGDEHVGGRIAPFALETLEQRVDVAGNHIDADPRRPFEVAVDDLVERVVPRGIDVDDLVHADRAGAGDSRHQERNREDKGQSYGCAVTHELSPHSTTLERLKCECLSFA